MTEQNRHILLMSSWFPNRLDPFAGNFIQRFGVLLAQDYQVTVIHTMGDKHLSNYEISDTVIDGVRTIIVYHPISIKNKFKHWWKQRKALRTALALVEDVDLLFAHVLLPRGLQFVKAKKYFNCPMLVLEHASYYRPAMRKRLTSVQRTIMKRTSVYIKRLMAVSEVLKKDMRPIFPTTQIDIIPEFVQLEHFQLKTTLAKEKKKFLHISTLDPLTKNPMLLCEGFKLAVENAIKESGSCDISLTVVSDQNTEKWQEWTKEQELSNYISFVGPATWEEIGAYVQAHDTLILTSVYETFSIVIVEAWLTGTPVISTSVGVASEMPAFLGQNVEQDNAVHLANTITAFSKGEYTFDPAAIREHALQFTDQHVLSQLKEQFERYFDIHD